ncbi:MAG: restriction endonuclease subunit S [Betaproteobacteria bacterium]|nr:MAG: restriction endonuclease subunit S [Betaproteobacteria bacterium]
MSISDVRRVKLVDIAAKQRWALNGGPFGSKLTTKHYTDSGVPVIRGTNLSGGSKFSFDDFVYVSEEKADELRPNNAHPGDIIFTQRGTIGQVGLIPRSAPFSRFVISQSQMKLTPDPEQADPEFLYYLFSAPATVKAIDNLAFSAGVPHINLEILRNFEVTLPSLPEQQRVAEILSTYDDLIENNQRRIWILEEMARALYREWFVEFRFPSGAKMARVASPLGDIPKGWEVNPLSAIAEVNRAQISPRNPPDEVHYIDIASVNPGQIDAVTTYAFPEAPGRARRIVQHGDVLWSCVRPNRRSHALVMFPDPDTIASTGFAVLTAKAVPYTFLYAATTTDEFVAYLTNNASGAAYPAVTASTFEKAMLLVPPQSLLRRFGEVTEPMAEEAHFLRLQSANLRKTRDLLLPRLLSGNARSGGKSNGDGK